MEIDYRKELLKTFKDDAYWLVNKHLASHLGLIPTILLSELISKENYHFMKNELIEHKYFYHKSEVIEDNLFITSDKRRSCVEILKNSGTISVITKGMPAKHYYSINHQRIIKLMSMESGTKEIRENLKSQKIRSETPSQETENSSDREIQSLDVVFSDLRDSEIQLKKSENQSTCDNENGITIYNNKENIKEDNNKWENNKGIPPEVQKDIEENERLLAIHRQQKEITALPQSPVYSSKELLGKSEEFIQKIGFGFTRNPRNILDAIYKQLPEDYQIKEDPKDIELVKSAVNQYESSPASERDALAKKFYGTVENMAKLYLIKKHGEEFRDKLYPEILNKNLIMYLNCNPTFKYCHGGFSNDIDGVYAEITRIVRKKTEKREQEAQREEEKRIERERVRELMVNRPHYSDEQIHAMGLKTMSEILEASRNKGSEVDLLDSKYTPIAPLSDRDRLREEELLRMAMSGQRLNGEEQAEFDYLRRKKAMGIV
jgi:hypothetical protein